jgi:hypothetical protein
VLDALELIARHALGALRDYPIEETIPMVRGRRPGHRAKIATLDRMRARESGTSTTTTNLGIPVINQQ